MKLFHTYKVNNYIDKVEKTNREGERTNMSDYNTAKYLSKQMKARGLQKLKYYCQICEKQCRDANGFQSHIRSPSHLRRISKVTDQDVENYSMEFERDFLLLLKLSHGEKWIGANKFYNEFIQDKNHIHMNATRFTSLNKFIQYLGKAGKVKVRDQGQEEENCTNGDVDVEQLEIRYIDRSQGNIKRKQMVEEMEARQKGEQEIKSLLLQRQIQLAAVSKGSSDDGDDGDDREEGTVTTTGDLTQGITLVTTPHTKQNRVKKPKSQKRRQKNVFDSL